jgi:two-component system NarL family sensor kinase
MIRIYSLLFFVSIIIFQSMIGNHIHAQNIKQIDSLKHIIETAKHDTTVVNAYMFWDELIYSTDPDLDLEINKKIETICTKNLEKILNEPEEKAYQLDLAFVLRTIGNTYYSKQDYLVAIRYYTKSYNVYHQLDDRNGAAKCLNNLGVVYQDTGNFAKSIGFFNRSMKMFEKILNYDGIATNWVNIGSIHLDQENFEKAETFFIKSLEIFEQMNVESGIADCLNNIGRVHHAQKENTEALNYFKKSLAIWEKIETVRGEADCLNNMGLVYSDQQEYEKAMEFHLQSLEIRKGIDDRIGIASSYNNIGDVYARQGQFSKTVEFNKKALEISKGIGNIHVFRSSSNALYKAYSELGDHEKSLAMYEQFIILEDSIKNIENQKKLLRVEYGNKSTQDSLRQAQSKQDAWYHTSLSVAKFEKEKASRYYWIIGLGGIILVLVLLVGILRFRAQKKFVNAKLLSKQKLVSAMINGQEEERKRISRELHDGIGAGLIAAKFKLSSKTAPDAYSMIEKTIKEIRDLSHQLIPPEIEGQNIKQSLEGYISTIKEDLPFNIEWISVGEFDEVRPEVKISIYRIVQECISNVIKYSKATELTVQLLEDGDNITLMVEDNGKGFIVSNNNSGIGLNNIESRVNDLNGVLEVDSNPGHGTTIVVDLSR